MLGAVLGAESWRQTEGSPGCAADRVSEGRQAGVSPPLSMALLGPQPSVAHII